MGFAKPDSCKGCPLYVLGESFAGTDGTGRNGVLLLGEALGEQEAEAGKPFQGAAGHMLTSILHRGGWKREDFLIANVVNCRPPENALEGMWYEAEAVARCRHFLEETLTKHPQIKVIVPMGNVALRACIGETGIKNFHGTVTWHIGWKRWVVPTLHPSFILRQGQTEVPTGVFDIARAITVAKVGWEEEVNDFIEYPSEADMERYVEEYEAALAANPETWLSVDIETPYSQDIDEEDREDADTSWDIVRASLAFSAHRAISFPYRDGYISLFNRALASRGTKVWWNGNKFDIPRLKAKGHIINGLQLDMMDGWHFLYPDLPKSLGYVSPFFGKAKAWKHEARTRQEYYSANDAWRALENAWGIKRELDKLGTWHVFLRDIVGIQPVFDDLQRIGVGIDEEKRKELRRFYEELRDNAVRLIREAVPRELKSKWQKPEGYKGKPRDVSEKIKANRYLGLPIEEDFIWQGLGYEKAITKKSEGEERWNRREEFNPNSPPQIIYYIEQRYGEKDVPKHKKTGKPTTSEEELERLARKKKDRVLELIVDSSNASTKLSNFINNWKTGPDGRVHPIFTNIPATFRLSSKNPNAQNFPHRDAEAAAMRQMVIPGEGWQYLFEGDYTGIEAVLVGWYAKDPDYIRLAKRGVHDFLAAIMMAKDGKYERISLTLSDNELSIALRECKKIGSKLYMPGSDTTYRDGAKKTIHGSNYRMGPTLMSRNYPEVFGTPKDAGRLQDLYFEIFPLIRKWQDKVVDDAYNDKGIVVSAFGYRRRFYNLKRWSFSKRLGKWELVWGDDAKKAIATLPQGSAAAIIRRAMLSHHYAELRKMEMTMLQIHDSLFNRARDERHLEIGIDLLGKAMIYPIPEMGGLEIPVEFKVGPNWGVMEEYGQWKKKLCSVS